MIVGVAITNRVTSTVSGIDGDYAPVCEDLSEGWTLVARDDLAKQPERLQLIGRRYSYIALMEGSKLLLIGARRRKAWDGSDEDVLRNPRYYEPFEHSHAKLHWGVPKTLDERWYHAHAQREAANRGHGRRRAADRLRRGGPGPCRALPEGPSGPSAPSHDRHRRNGQADRARSKDAAGSRFRRAPQGPDRRSGARAQDPRAPAGWVLQPRPGRRPATDRHGRGRSR